MESEPEDLDIISYRFKIAERNRIAKLKFINKKKMDRSLSHHETGPEYLDLSVPGTPVCSRYLALRRQKSVSSQSPEAVPVISSPTFEMALKTFRTNIDQLKTPTPVSDLDVDPIATYFKTSETQQQYQRQFSEATQTLGVPMKGTPQVKAFFDESEAKKSYARSFSEAVHTPVKAVAVAIPAMLKEDPVVVPKPCEPLQHIEIQPDEYFEKSKNSGTFQRQFSEVVQVLGTSTERSKEQINQYFESSKERKTYSRAFSEAVTEVPESVLVILEDSDLAVPGTPISSKKLPKLEKCQNAVFQEIHENHTPPTPNAAQAGREVRESLIEQYLAKTDVLVPKDIKPQEYFEQSDKTRSYKREFSEVVQVLERRPSLARELSVPGTPVDSRHLTSSTFRQRKDFKFISDSEDEMVHDGLSGRSVKYSKFGRDLKKPIAEPMIINNDEELCPEVKEFFKSTQPTHEPVVQELPPICPDRKAVIDEYLDSSVERKTYQRSFSEVTSFLKQPNEKPTLSRSSSRKSSLAEKLNLSVPGTPVSSRYVMERKAELISDSSDTDTEPEREKTKDELKAEFQKFVRQMEKLKVGDTSELVETVNSEDDRDLQRPSVLNGQQDTNDADDEIDDDDMDSYLPPPIKQPKQIGFSPTSFQHRKMADQKFRNFWDMVLKKPTKVHHSATKRSGGKKKVVN